MATVSLKRAIMRQAGETIKPGIYQAKIIEGFAYLLDYPGLGVTLEFVDILDDKVEFICPVDQRVKIFIDNDLAKVVPHCTSLFLKNSECPYLKAGCVGCSFDKEYLIETSLSTWHKTQK